MNCEVDGSSGSMICAWTPSTPGTPAMARIVAAGRMPPAVKPVPTPLPPVATLADAADALAHGAERDQPGHADGDAEHREEIPPQDSQRPHHDRRGTPLTTAARPGSRRTSGSAAPHRPGPARSARLAHAAGRAPSAGPARQA